jgi:hypothetical protein
VTYFGPQVRRLSRAFKGMRDAASAKSDLRSICLMAALVTALENLGRQDDKRDDLALLATARELVDVLRHPIVNPVFPDDPAKNLCDGWTSEFRQQARDLFQRAADELHDAIYGTVNKDIALNRLRRAFGPRTPTDVGLITLLGAAAVIRSEPARPQPQPMPVRTRSG